MGSPSEKEGQTDTCVETKRPGGFWDGKCIINKYVFDILIYII